MKCPHCHTTVHTQETYQQLESSDELCHTLVRYVCPSCNHYTIDLIVSQYWDDFRPDEIVSRHRLWPKGASRSPCPKEVPSVIAEDYNEACLVLEDSPKASAALSRRCLQGVLRDAGNVKASDLNREIQEVIDGGSLPSHLADTIDAIRNIGNFAAHPSKSSSTGDVVPVEPHEAEWNLDVLESLFDFYYVQPAKIKEKRDALNGKLRGLGKPPMK